MIEVKPLSCVTLEDAKTILKSGYGSFFRTGRWQIEDTTKDINEPSMKVFCKTKDYQFWFQNDKIDIELVPNDDLPITFDGINFDVRLVCYITAVKLGYYVPELTPLIDP